ncbi:hypothetical protein MRB53_021096 [Persea americana]|uniref:Uncharacterized protein n=1 Tax=Persea americana TaxID=3435 RepID=A0ACC2L2T3_PERAE|nr:hypothetical protein MRB53_021096 [Persea americana]
MAPSTSTDTANSNEDTRVPAGIVSLDHDHISGVSFNNQDQDDYRIRYSSAILHHHSNNNNPSATTGGKKQQHKNHHQLPPTNPSLQVLYEPNLDPSQKARKPSSSHSQVKFD